MIIMQFLLEKHASFLVKEKGLIEEHLNFVMKVEGGIQHLLRDMLEGLS